MTAVAALCVAAALPVLAGTGKSISINFAGPRDSTANPGDSAFSAVSGSALFGALPVAGDNWNNFQTHSSTHGSGVASASSIKFNDGSVAAGVSASWNASCTYSVSASSTSDNIFNSFLDGSDAQTLTLSGLTPENGFPSTCTVYIYCASDRVSSKAVFCPKTVNGTTYTYANGAVTAGTTSWGSCTFAQNNKLVLGGDYLKIEGVEITDGTVTVSYAAASDGTTTKYHGSLSAVQIDFGERSDYTLSVNFSGGQNKNDQHYGPVSGTDTYGAVPIAGDYWNNVYARVMEAQTGFLWNDGAAHPGSVTFAHTCDHTWAKEATVTSGNLFYSYLDDRDHSCTISGLTAANGFPGYCWVYVYLSSDNGSRTFEPVTVNGVTYTYSANVVQEGSGAWGSSANAVANTLVHGGDYLKIGPVLLENTGGRVDVSVVNLGNKSKYRGAIAAVQVAVPVPTTFTVTATSEGQGTVAIGQGAPGATVSVDGTFGTPVATTLTATAASGYLFDHWEGPLGLLTSGTASDATVSVRTSMPAEFKAVFLRDDVVATATWTGAGTAGDLSDTNNWLCANSSGVTIEGGLPGADTTIVITGQTAFSFPENASLTYHAIRFDNVQLTADVNWNGLDFAKVAPGSSIDLCGNDLEMTAFNGSVINAWSVTDSSAQGSGGKFILTVAEGDEFVNGITPDNGGIVFSGSLRFVKEGTGAYRVHRAGQTYTGGTHVKVGTVICDIGTANAANRNPFGIGDKTQTIRIEKGAVLDFNTNINGSIYNYELGGKIKIRGANQDAAWDTTFNNTWMQDIVLIDDATIEGGWLHFGSNDANDYGELDLNGKTLTVEINVGSGNDCQCYAKYLRITQTGTIKINAASAGAWQIDSSFIDFSAANLQVEGNAFLFLAGNNTGSILVRDFAYTDTRNYWAAHKQTACKVVVGGVYKAGAYRPPVELANGATLDLSGVSDSWNATGHNGNISANNTYVSNNPGQVTFASGSTIAVNLGERVFEQGKTKVVNWATPPTDVAFVRGETAQGDVSFKVKDDGLYAFRPLALMILVR
jgi:hypothetical protein